MEKKDNIRDKADPSKQHAHFTKMKLVPFQKEHFPTYLQWFENKKIKEALYDIDDEWLEYIMTDSLGCEYAVMTDQKLIAVVGIDYPTSTHPSYAIKNIAVNPEVFRRGIGSEVLKLLQKEHPLKPGESWIAFVEKKNKSALRFFRNNGWKEKGIEEEMIKFEKK